MKSCRAHESIIEIKKVMKKTAILSLFFLGATSLFAQTAREEIEANPLLCASNYTAYVDPTEAPTAAPKGYEPFYMSHYGRHGSRWLIDNNDYANLIETMQKAKDNGKLTAEGEEMLSQLKAFHKTTYKRLGELTTVGERQHHRIGKRMTKNFPEIFGAKNTQVDARSTVVIRCILSMEACCEELTAFNPKMKIHNDVSESFQYYLNDDQGRHHDIIDATRPVREELSRHKHEYINPERFSRVIFNDEEYVKNNVNALQFMYGAYEVAANMQSHDTDIDFLKLFTIDELYDCWRYKSTGWFINYGNYTKTRGMGQFHEANLLRNFIATADTIVDSKTFHGATLRFGHESCVLPMAVLLELGEVGKEIADLSKLHDTYRDYKVFPMGSNIQLIFYRPKKGNGDILVKAMLNEREMALPAEAVSYPYYRWSDLKAYYQKKLDDYDHNRR